MKSTITSTFSASLRACAIIVAVTFIIQIQACVLTEEERISREALREEALYEIHSFIGECEASGGIPNYQGHLRGRDDLIRNIPRDALLKDYACIDPTEFAQAQPRPLPRPTPRLPTKPSQ